MRRRWWILALTGLISLGAVKAASTLRVDTDILKFFNKRTELRRAYRFVSKKFPGATTLEIMLKSPEAQIVRNPSFLRELARLQSDLLTIPHIHGALSSISYLRELDRTIRGDNQTPESLFRNQEYISQLLFLFTMGSRSGWYQYASKDSRTLRVTLFVEALSTKRMERLFHQVEKKLEEHVHSPVKAHLVGTTKLYVNMNRYLLHGQIQSLTMAFTVIGILMILLFRSIRIALISMISNVIPIFLTLAVMSLSDIPLDISTVVIGPIAMGIVVDDTIHFIFCYLRLRRQGNSITETLNQTLSIVGKPITLTSITLGLCFGILAFSHFLPIIYFGKLTALTMGFAWVAVLILLPALLTLLESLFARRGRSVGGSLGFSEE